MVCLVFFSKMIVTEYEKTRITRIISISKVLLPNQRLHNTVDTRWCRFILYLLPVKRMTLIIVTPSDRSFPNSDYPSGILKESFRIPPEAEGKPLSI
jgi:hypothetical protein